MTSAETLLDPIDRALINRLQRGLPIVPQPYAAVAAELGLTETDRARGRTLHAGGHRRAAGTL